ncbi:GspH/FimT family pseudopilin [Aquisalimonas asiatica]|uniref:Type II secretion system protein H n=1 Tax=Aquisalimonas asiatica TaxID=406100 RepID=A0A1H8S2I8_9GAMM|nr:GspH/FimT family pseudopilin [Aquisalimonas asiatica]SEO72901.1 type IV fimbrial biogenesis protein FimT [Aquisalimonas asiatica]
MHKEKGFTLIELMVAIAVMGVLLTVGIPGFQYLMQSSQISTQTNELVTALSTARSEAVRQNAEVTVEPVGSEWGNGFRVMLDDSGEPLRVFDGSDSVNITGDAEEVNFLGDGSRGFDADRITFNITPLDDCFGDMQRTITITAGGSIRSERGPC